MRLDPSASLQPVQCRIQRSLLHLKHAAGNLLDAFGNRPAVLRAQRNRLQNQKVQRSLRKIDAFFVAHTPPLASTGRAYTFSCRSARGNYTDVDVGILDLKTGD